MMNTSNADNQNQALIGMNHAIARENLSLVKSILDKHGITFWLSWGTCLGAIREQNFIAHDGDIDLEIYRKDWYRLLILLPEFKAQGFTFVPLSSNSFMPGWLLGFHFDRLGEQVDICCCYKAVSQNESNDSKISGWISGGCFIEEDFFSELEAIDFLGEAYKVPHNTTAYLTYVYGSTWRISQKDFWGYWNLKSQNSSIDFEIHKKNLYLIKLVFEKHGIQFWLAEKTCLEAVTQNNTLNPNSGIYLNADLKDKKKVLQILSELKELEFEVIKDSAICHTNELMSLAIKISRCNELINIEFIRKPKFYQRLRGNRWICGSKRFTWNCFEQFQNINFLGNTYKIPAQPKRYLSDLYGPIWQENNFDTIENSEEKDWKKSTKLFAKILHKEEQMELQCREPWLLTWQLKNNLILAGDILQIKVINEPIAKGMIVLVGDRLLRVGNHRGYFTVQRIIEIKSDKEICLTSDFYSQGNTWCTASDIVGQVVALRSRFGFTIPLKSKAIQIIFPIVMPLLRKIRSL